MTMPADVFAAPPTENPIDPTVPAMGAVSVAAARLAFAVSRASCAVETPASPLSERLSVDDPPAAAAPVLAPALVPAAVPVAGAEAVAVVGAGVMLRTGAELVPAAGADEDWEPEPVLVLAAPVPVLVPLVVGEAAVEDPPWPEASDISRSANVTFAWAVPTADMAATHPAIWSAVAGLADTGVVGDAMDVGEVLTGPAALSHPAGEAFTFGAVVGGVDDVGGAVVGTVDVGGAVVGGIDVGGALGGVDVGETLGGAVLGGVGDVGGAVLGTGDVGETLGGAVLGGVGDVGGAVLGTGDVGETLGTGDVGETLGGVGGAVLGGVDLVGAVLGGVVSVCRRGVPSRPSTGRQACFWALTAASTVLTRGCSRASWDADDPAPSVEGGVEPAFPAEPGLEPAPEAPAPPELVVPARGPVAPGRPAEPADPEPADPEPDPDETVLGDVSDASWA